MEKLALLFRRILPAQKPGARLYCVGMPKTGTHSIATMFSRAVRSKHEPEAKLLIEKILEASAGRISGGQLRDWIARRDRRLRLAVDSSNLNFFILDTLLREFEDARFVLTIRDCYSWLNSMANQSTRLVADPEWVSIRELRFKAHAYRHPPEERAFKAHGLYTLDGYLSSWAEHNQKVLSAVPAEKLLVVRTDQISERAFEIAEFAGLPRTSVDPQACHSFQNPERRNFLREIDREYLEEKVGRYCRPLMGRFFPAIACQDDASL